MPCCPNPCSRCCKPKIKFRLEKWEKALVFQVLEMDERFKNTTWEAKNGLDIVSMLCPDVTERGLWLRGGSKDSDIRVASQLFVSDAERDARYDTIIAALKDWALNWPGFKENKCQSNCTGEGDGNIFTF